MEFNFSEEQEITKASLKRFFSEKYDIPKRTNYLSTERGFSEANWKQLADLGVLGLPFPEEDGGLGGGLVEIMILMEEAGAALAVDPLLQSVILPVALLRHARPEFKKQDFVESLASGAIVLCFSLSEPNGRFNHLNVSMRAQRNGEKYVLTGQKSVALYAPGADGIVVSARVSGQDLDRDGIGLFYVDPNADGVCLRKYAAVDGVPAADLQLEGVVVEPEGVLVAPDNGATALDDITALATFAVSAEMLGVIQHMLETTVSYMQTRVQFGRPLAMLQVVRHRLADIYLHTEQTRSAVLGAALRPPFTAEWRKAVSSAKVRACKAADFVGKQSIQLHGGIGVTDEYEISHYYKHLLSLQILFGDGPHHALSLGTEAVLAGST